MGSDINYHTLVKDMRQSILGLGHLLHTHRLDRIKFGRVLAVDSCSWKKQKVCTCLSNLKIKT